MSKIYLFFLTKGTTKYKSPIGPFFIFSHSITVFIFFHIILVYFEQCYKYKRNSQQFFFFNHSFVNKFLMALVPIKTEFGLR